MKSLTTANTGITYEAAGRNARTIREEWEVVGDEGRARLGSSSGGGRGDCGGGGGGGGGNWARRGGIALVAVVPGQLDRVVIGIQIQLRLRTLAHAHTSLGHESDGVGSATLEGERERLDEARSILIQIVVVRED